MSSWDSPALAGVPVDVRVLAEEVAADLHLLTSTVVEVARLHLEALDTAMALDVPELLADQMRWQSVRLESAGAAFGAEDVDKTLQVIVDNGGTVVRDAEDTPYGRLAAATDHTGAAFNLSSLQS